MKVFLKNIGVVIGVTLVQWIMLISAIHLLNLARDTFVDSAKIDLYWGRSLWIGLEYLFLPSFILMNAFISLINHHWVKFLMIILLLSCVLYMWLDVIMSYPYRGLVIYIIYAILFCVGAYLTHKLRFR